MHKQILLALVATLAPLGAQAEGTVNGAEVGFYSSGFAEGKMRAANNMALKGSLEYGFTPMFAGQVDVAQHHFTNSGDNGTALTLHAIAHFGNGAAVGGFFGKEWIEGNHYEHYGLEAKHSFGTTEFEASYGRLSYTAFNTDFTSDLFGLKAEHALSDTLTLGGSYDRILDDRANMTRLNATLGYRMANGLELASSLGLADGNRMDREVTMGFSLKTSLGGNGTSFGPRSVQSFLPGN